MNLISLEKKYSKEFDTFFNSFRDCLDEMVKLKNVDLDQKEVTQAILLRLHSWYSLQNKIKKSLKKRIATPGSDFFVETLLFYLKVAFEILNVNQEVHSEEQIKRKRGAIRPDISIWKGNKVVAIIECKTQLGWNRHGWKEDFMEKEEKLRSEFPDAKAYLVVMTSKNWPGFGEDENVGKKFFTLYNAWPSEIDPTNSLDKYVVNPIEPLIKSLTT
jgi:hypothetical protein